ncbi:MAG TPA: hypothetical protein VF502_02815 [Stellaceae bacterium]
MNKSMNKSMVIGGVVILALGAVAAHAIGIGAGPLVQRPVVAGAKPMTPLQMMRHAREQADQSVDSPI